MKYLLHVAFDGLAFKGTQRQKKEKTVQGEIEKILLSIYQKDIQLECCSRLDSDVSAMDFVCCFSPSDNRISKDKISYAISNSFNGKLRVKSVEEIEDGFSPRYDAHKKTYLYILNLSGEPFLQTHAFYPGHPFDKEAYKEAMMQFLGKHDFCLFSSKDDRKNESESFESTILKIGFEEKDDFLLTFVAGTNFNRYQVRFMVGAAIEVATNKITIDEIRKRLAGNGDVSCPRFKAPGKGLVLYKVEY